MTIPFGKFCGGTVWVLGNGPSLHTVDWTKLPRERCIGVNRLYETTWPWSPDWMLFMDMEVWKQQKDKLLISDATFLVGDALDKQLKEELPLKRTFVFTRHDKLPGLNGPLHRGNNTGYYASEIAARMVHPGGRVILTGMDLCAPDEGPTHSFGRGVEFGCSEDPNRFKAPIEAFCKLKTAFQGKVEFFHAGPSELLKNGFSPFLSLTDSDT